MSSAIEVDNGDGNTVKFHFPESLRRKTAVLLGNTVRVIDATQLRPEMQNLIVMAANGEDLPNCDALLYTPDNFENWARIAEARSDNGEREVIRRAAEAHARILQPPETMGFWSIGPGDRFNDKERIVIEAHLAEGHTFDYFAYSDVNEASLTKSVDDGKRVAQELGLGDIDHIPILGNVFNKNTIKDDKSKLGSSRVIATSFGFTFQNLRGPVAGYAEAAESLRKSLEKVKQWLPRDSRLLVTLDHQTDRDRVLEDFTGQPHDDFFQRGVAHHLGEDVAEVTELRRRFTPRTAILNREGVLREPVVFDLGQRGQVLLRDGTKLWNGISARIPAATAIKAFDDARLPSAFPDPVYNHDRTLGCHVALKR
jgi:hypothetical protein